MQLQSKWVKIYAILLCLFAFFAGVMAYAAPQSMFSMLQLNWEEAKMLTAGFGARNIAFGILALIAILGKNLLVYQALFITRLAIDSQDLINALLAGPEKMHPVSSIVFLLLFFIIPLALGILQINREIKAAREL